MKKALLRDVDFLALMAVVQGDLGDTAESKKLLYQAVELANARGLRRVGETAEVLNRAGSDQHPHGDQRGGSGEELQRGHGTVFQEVRTDDDRPLSSPRARQRGNRFETLRCGERVVSNHGGFHDPSRKRFRRWRKFGVGRSGNATGAADI